MARRKILFEAKQRSGARTSEAYDPYMNFCNQVHRSFPVGLIIFEERPQGYAHGTVVPERFQVQSALPSDDVNGGAKSRVEDVFSGLYLNDFYEPVEVEQ